MANSFQTTNYITDEVLVRFLNETALCKLSYRRFEEDFKNLRFATGQTLNYRLEENYTVGTGAVANAQDRIQKIRALTVDQQRHVMVNYNSVELTYDRAKDKPYLDMAMGPQIRNLANAVEQNLADEMKDSFYFTVGDPTASINSPSAINQARGEMRLHGIPDDGMNHVVLTVDDSVSLANGVNNYFNEPVNTQGLMKGLIGRLAGMDIVETVFLGKHTAGTGDGNAAVAGLIPAGAIKGAVSSGSSLLVDGLPATTNGVFKKGDVIVITDSSAQPYFVNPISKASTARKAQFTVTADVNSDGAGEATVPVSPEIIISGAYQKFTGAIPDNATVQIYDSHNVSLAFHMNALVFAAPRMAEKVGGVVSKTQYSDRYKVSVRYEQGADITNDLQLDRLDVLFGRTVNPEYGVRIMSKPD